MKTRIIGDIHGKLGEYKQIIESADASIQVGDFGIGFNGDCWHDEVNELHANNQHRFIRGNHDDPQMCVGMSGWIPDMTVEGDVMFLGGAWSIDGTYRQSCGLHWWPEEELSPKELYRAVDLYEKIKPRIMITHDCPESIATKMFFDHGLTLSGRQYPTRTGSALQSMLEIHQPKQWYFGHYHHTIQHQEGITSFQCIGESDFVDVDLSK